MNILSRTELGAGNWAMWLRKLCAGIGIITGLIHFDENPIVISVFVVVLLALILFVHREEIIAYPSYFVYRPSISLPGKKGLLRFEYSSVKEVVYPVTYDIPDLPARSQYLNEVYSERKFLVVLRDGRPKLIQTNIGATYILLTFKKINAKISETKRGWEFEAEDNGNIVFAKFNRDGKVQFARTIPKLQVEKMSKNEVEYVNFPSGTPVGFYTGENTPYFHPYSALLKGKLVLLYNDDQRNASVTNGDRKIKSYGYEKANNTYKVEVNLASGMLTKTLLNQDSNGYGGMVRFASGTDVNVFPFLQ